MSEPKILTSQQTVVDATVWTGVTKEGFRLYNKTIRQCGIRGVDGEWLVRPGDIVAVVRWIERIGTSDGLGGFIVPTSLEWNQLWVAAFSIRGSENGDDQAGELLYFDLSGSDREPVCLPAPAYKNAVSKHRTGTDLYHVHRACRLVRDVRGTLTEAEVGEGRFEHHVPGQAMNHLRRAARLPEAVLGQQSNPKGKTALTEEKLKLMIRQQLKAESKSHLTDDIYIAAYRDCGSGRAAATFLSQQIGRTVSKDSVYRAIARAGGTKAVLRTDDSESIQRHVASQGRDRQQKYASPTQPPEIK